MKPPRCAQGSQASHRRELLAGKVLCRAAPFHQACGALLRAPQLQTVSSERMKAVQQPGVLSGVWRRNCKRVFNQDSMFTKVNIRKCHRRNKRPRDQQQPTSPGLSSEQAGTQGCAIMEPFLLSKQEMRRNQNGKRYLAVPFGTTRSSPGCQDVNTRGTQVEGARPLPPSHSH